MVLMKLGFIHEPIMWLSEPQYFWGIVGASHVWKEVGWNAIIYLAAITSIDPSLYEAAEIDGANRYQKMLAHYVAGHQIDRHYFTDHEYRLDSGRRDSRCNTCSATA